MLDLLVGLTQVGIIRQLLRGREAEGKNLLQLLPCFFPNPQSVSGCYSRGEKY
ncbi:hypothetical protein [Nostoc sp.]|uniref:hypothetical protein n=1 Tax=Nostoc sp. TaxID=1180 RepID=UPI002FF0578C